MKAFSILILVLICHHYLDAQNKPLSVVPFELKSDSRIYIKCRVNNSDTLTFLFDTGAGAMVINSAIIGKKVDLNLDSETNNLGANGINKVKLSTKNTMTFGSIQIDSVAFLAIPYGKVAFDGVFGFNLMKDYVIEINYHKKLMYFYASKNYMYETSGYDHFDLKFGLGVPTFKASLTVGDKKVAGDFEMDTGGDSGLILASYFSTKHNLAQQFKQVAKAAITGSDGVSTAIPIVMVPEIYLANKHFYRIPALLSNTTTGLLANPGLTGIFGNLFLKRFDMILDIAHHQVFLKPNDLVHTSYYEFLVK